MTCETRCFHQNQLFIISNTPFTFAAASKKCGSIPGGKLLISDHSENLSSCCKADEENKQLFWTGLSLNQSCQESYSYTLASGQNECLRNLSFTVRSTEDSIESCVSLALELPSTTGRSFEAEQRACDKTAGYICAIKTRTRPAYNQTSQYHTPTTQASIHTNTANHTRQHYGTSQYRTPTTQASIYTNTANHTTQHHGTTVQAHINPVTSPARSIAAGRASIQSKAIAGGVAGLLVLIIIALIAFQYRRKKQIKKRSQSETDILRVTETSLTSPIYNEIEQKPQRKDVQEKEDKQFPNLSQYSFAASNPDCRKELQISEDHEYVVIKPQLPRFPASKQQLSSTSRNGTNTYGNILPSTSATGWHPESEYLEPLPFVKPK